MKSPNQSPSSPESPSKKRKETALSEPIQVEVVLLTNSLCDLPEEAIHTASSEIYPIDAMTNIGYVLATSWNLIVMKIISLLARHFLLKS